MKEREKVWFSSAEIKRKYPNQHDNQLWLSAGAARELAEVLVALDSRYFTNKGKAELGEVIRVLLQQEYLTQQTANQILTSNTVKIYG